MGRSVSDKGDVIRYRVIRRTRSVVNLQEPVILARYYVAPKPIVSWFQIFVSESTVNNRGSRASSIGKGVQYYVVVDYTFLILFVYAEFFAKCRRDPGAYQFDSSHYLHVR